MKAVDFRNSTWGEIRDQLSGYRMAVHSAFVAHGPATTRDVAEKSRIPLLTLRPRVTELLTLGFLELVGDERGCEGVYRARTLEEARAHMEHMQRCPEQVEMRLGVCWRDEVPWFVVRCSSF